MLYTKNAPQNQHELLCMTFNDCVHFKWSIEFRFVGQSKIKKKIFEKYHISQHVPNSRLLEVDSTPTETRLFNSVILDATNYI